MKRYDILNALIKKYGYSNYLEIGIHKGKNFEEVSAKNKAGVDPNRECKYQMTSDDFFKQIGKDVMYDLIFIDGLHTDEQVTRDINNSLEHLAQSGTIVVHDCSPATEIQTTLPMQVKKWNGSVYKGFVRLKMSRGDLSMCVVDTDYGCGIIRRGKQKISSVREITYDEFDKNRIQLLNLISTKEFADRLNNGSL